MKFGIRSKLLIGFLAAALLGSAIGGVGIVGITNGADADTRLYKLMTVPLGDMIAITESFQRIRINLRDYIDAAPGSEEARGFERTIETLRAKFNDHLAPYQSTIQTESAKAAFAQFETNYQRYFQNLDEMIALVKAGSQGNSQNNGPRYCSGYPRQYR